MNKVLSNLWAYIAASIVLALVVATTITSAYSVQRERKSLEQRISECEAVLLKRVAIREVTTQILTESGYANARTYQDLPALVLIPHESTREHATHELSLATAYAQSIRDQRQETFIFVPAMGLDEVPAFDGIVLNSELVPIANVSLKTVTGRGPRSPLKKGLTSIKNFSRRGQWYEFLNLFHKDNSNRYNENELRSRLYERKVKWIDKVFSWFGIENEVPRLNRIVLEVTEASPSSENIDAAINGLLSFEAKLKDLNVHQVTVIHQGVAKTKSF